MFIVEAMDNELVRRKKIGGRDGKKKWKRQSDTSNLQLFNLKEAKMQVAENSRAKSAGPMFKIQIEPDVEIKKKLDKDRFKAKMNPEFIGKSEKKLLKRIEKHEAKGDHPSTGVEHGDAKSKSVIVKKSEPTKKRDPDLEADFDVWGVDLVDLNIHHKKPEVNTKNVIETPKVLKPYAGQSYNPSFQDHLELMKVVVNKAEDKRAIFKSKSEKAEERTKKQALQKRPPQKPKTKKEKELFDEHAKQREVKRKVQDGNNIDRLFREEKNRQRKHGSA